MRWLSFSLVAVLGVSLLLTPYDGFCATPIKRLGALSHPEDFRVYKKLDGREEAKQIYPDSDWPSLIKDDGSQYLIVDVYRDCSLKINDVDKVRRYVSLIELAKKHNTMIHFKSSFCVEVLEIPVIRLKASDVGLRPFKEELTFTDWYWVEVFDKQSNVAIDKVCRNFTQNGANADLEDFQNQLDALQARNKDVEIDFTNKCRGVFSDTSVVDEGHLYDPNDVYLFGIFDDDEHDRPSSVYICDSSNEQCPGENRIVKLRAGNDFRRYMAVRSAQLMLGKAQEEGLMVSLRRMPFGYEQLFVTITTQPIQTSLSEFRQ